MKKADIKERLEHLEHKHFHASFYDLSRLDMAMGYIQNCSPHDVARLIAKGLCEGYGYTCDNEQEYSTDLTHPAIIAASNKLKVAIVDLANTVMAHSPKPEYNIEAPDIKPEDIAVKIPTTSIELDADKRELRARVEATKSKELEKMLKLYERVAIADDFEISPNQYAFACEVRQEIASILDALEKKN